MSAATELRAALVAWTPLAALVGSRIRTDVALESDALPFVVFRRMSVDRVRGLDNSVHAKRESFQLECWAETRAAATDVSEAVTDALDAAGLPTEPSDPDAIDPTTAERAVVLNVDVWT